MVYSKILTANDGGTGDYYTIQDNEKNYIFDGGNKKNISNAPRKVDIIICSHNDKDHIEGIKTILKKPKTIVNEVCSPRCDRR